MQPDAVGHSTISLSGFPRYRLALVVFMVVLVGALAVFAAVFTWKNEMHGARADFEKIAQRVTGNLQRQLDTCVEATERIKEISDSDRNVSRARFLAFTRGVMTGLPSIQALNYIPRVPAGDRSRLEASVRAEGFQDFTITERSPDGNMIPASQRPVYYPVLYVEPFEENRAAFGFDLGSNPARLDALGKARDMGVSVASGRVSLVTREEGNSGFLIFHPLYRRDAPVQSVEERRRNLQGFSLSVFRFDNLFAHATGGLLPEELTLRLLDRSAPPEEELLYSQAPPANAGNTPGWSVFPEPEFETWTTLRAAHREWTLRLATTPVFFTTRLTWHPWVTLGAGLIITVLLGMYAFMTIRLFDMADTNAAERASSELRLREKIHQIIQAEREARDKEEKLQILLAGIKAATLTIDATSFTILDMNPVAESLFSVSAKEWIGRPHRELFGRNMRPLDARTDMLQAVFDGENASASGEFLLELADGRLVPLNRTVLSASITGKTYIFEVLFDISDKKTLERQLGLAQKLESIGQLASGIAHEINTPIQYVSGNLGFLQDAFKSLENILARYEALASSAGTDPSLGEELQGLSRAKEQARYQELVTEIPGSISDSIAGVERVAVIVGAMKKFSHPDVAEKRLLDVNKAIESTLTITRNEWKYNCDMQTDFDPASPLLFCFPGDFNQVILNLVVNAAHAISDKFQGTGKKGLLTVSTTSDDTSVTIRVSDTGTGIPPENTSRIFDPFFTTKEVGKGTGQGLAIVHSVVERHGATIDLESTPGEGTTFTLRFPLGQEHHA